MSLLDKDNIEGFGGHASPIRSFHGFAVFATVGLMLAGCATTQAPSPEPVVRIVNRDVPVPVPCAAKIAAAPLYADKGASLAGDIFEQTRALLLGIEQRAEREAKLEGAVRSCGGKVGE